MEPTPTPEAVPPTEEAPAPPKLSRKERVGSVDSCRLDGRLNSDISKGFSVMGMNI